MDLIVGLTMGLTMEQTIDPNWSRVKWVRNRAEVLAHKL